MPVEPFQVLHDLTLDYLVHYADGTIHSAASL